MSSARKRPRDGDARSSAARKVSHDLDISEEQLAKKPAIDTNSSSEERSDDEEFGPRPIRAPSPPEELKDLPTSSRYQRSWLHRDIVTHVLVSGDSQYVLSASKDGVVKFWRRVADPTTLVEFVKQYQAHSGPIAGFGVSSEGEWLISTCSEEKSIKFYHVKTFDLVRGLDGDDDFAPSLVCWISKPNSPRPLVAIADRDSAAVRVYDTAGEKVSEFRPSSFPLTCMVYHSASKCAISTDKSGAITYWASPDSGVDAPYAFPKKTTGIDSKLDTHLYEVPKRKLKAASLVASIKTLFACVTSQGLVLVFDFFTGKLVDEFNSGASAACFDHSGKLLLVSAPSQGILVYEPGQHVQESRPWKVFGDADADVWSNFITLAQTEPVVDHQLERAVAASRATSVSNKAPEAISSGSEAIGPLLLGCSVSSHRFYVASTRDPIEGVQRDVLNEKPNKAELERLERAERARRAAGLATLAVLHTSLGDIKIQLLPLECPRTIENFQGHAKKGTYDGVIFHRVIKGFMIQTGDPKGDGTGGESIWGGEFEDEIRTNLKHDRAYIVSMANAGPNTNGSQFFITTAACTHLDGKHTVFGRVVSGQEVVNRIESAAVDAADRPFETIKIFNVDCS